MYSTTSISPEEIRQAAEKNDHAFFLNIIGHYLAYPLYGDNWKVCQTREACDENYHPSSNLLSNAIYLHGHNNVSLYDGKICFEGSNPPIKWEAPLPDLIVSLLDQIELFGRDRAVSLLEFEPVWENWFAYHRVGINPEVYQFL